MKEFTAEMAHAAVEKGAAWLDERDPEWAERIDLELLDLQDGEFCMLGQEAERLVGPHPRDLPKAGNEGYWRVLDSLGYGPFSSWQVERGFDVPHHEIGRGGLPSEAAYEMLTIAWREYIRQRLGAADEVQP